MAALIGTSVAFFLCIALGRFGEALFLGGVICGFGFVFPTARTIAVYVTVASCALAIMVANASWLSCFFPGLAVYLTRSALPKNSSVRAPHLWLVFLPAAILLLSSPDRDVSAFSWLAIGLTIPVMQSYRIPETNRFRISRAIEMAAVLIIMISVAIVLVFRTGTNREGFTAILRSGEWAKTEVRPSLNRESISISSMYSYSALRDLLAAKVISIVELDSRFAEAWLITPTRPFSVSEIDNLLTWVRGGGHLIIVSDHSDLFGHARTLSVLLRDVGLHTSSTTFFPPNPTGVADVSFRRGLSLKTANTQSGLFLWPSVSARWIDEDVDYSGRSFFGAMSPSDDDRYGRRVIAGSKRVGLGSITLFGDSTILANFAIFQPRYIPLLEKLRNPSRFCGVFPLLLFGLSVGIILAALTRRLTVLGFLPMLGLLTCLDIGGRSVCWVSYDWWSGDERAVMEWHDSRESVSTLYALSIAGGRYPRWTENWRESPGGIWVGKNGPPGRGWKWLDLSAAETEEVSYDRRLLPLLSRVNHANPLRWSATPDSAHLKVGGCWTNEVMGDWWVDRGISESKLRRLEAFLSWVVGISPPVPVEGYKSTSKDKCRYILHISGQPPIELVLPKISLQAGDHIFLGRGVSADVVLQRQSLCLVGTRSYTEGWEAPEGWVVCPILDECE